MILSSSFACRPLPAAQNLGQRLAELRDWAETDRSRDHDGIELLARAVADPLLRSKAACELRDDPELAPAGHYLEHQMMVQMVLDEDETFKAGELSELLGKAREPELEVRHELFPATPDPGAEMRQAVRERLAHPFGKLLERFDVEPLCQALGDQVPGEVHARLLEGLVVRVGEEDALAALPAALAALDQGQEAALQAGAASVVPGAAEPGGGVALTRGGVHIGGSFLRRRSS